MSWLIGIRVGKVKVRMVLTKTEPSIMNRLSVARVRLETEVN